jgi:hypothetical protein
MAISSSAQDAVGVRTTDMGVRVRTLVKYMVLYLGHIFVSMGNNSSGTSIAGSALVHTLHQGKIKKNRPLVAISSSCARDEVVRVRLTDMKGRVCTLIKYMILYLGHIFVSMES